MRMTFTLQDAEQCAERYIERGKTCGGCKFSSVCGMGEHNRRGLITLLEKVDPTRRNITVIALGPLAKGAI